MTEEEFLRQYPNSSPAELEALRGFLANGGQWNSNPNQPAPQRDFSSVDTALGGVGQYNPQGANPQEYLDWLNTVGLFGGTDAAAQAGYAPTEQNYADAAQYNQTNATNSRYGTDLSWLDPSFQMTPALLGQSQASQAYADPNAIRAQQDILGQTMRAANTPLNFESSARQNSVFNNLSNLRAPDWTGSSNQQQQVFGELGALRAPDWTGSSNEQYTALGAIKNSYRPQWDTQAEGEQWTQYGNLNNLQGPQFGTDDQQQDVYGRLLARSSGEGAPEWGSDEDQQAALAGLFSANPEQQQEQYGNLQEIIAGGGATEIERANRQTQRADQEQWLRSQREADLASAAERGFSGSAEELLSLGQDRQAAAGRNSLADLQTAAQLEQRRTDAIGNASNLAGQIRGQNLQQYTAAGDLASNIRGQTFQENSYADQSALQALLGSGNMANALRQNAYQEGMGTANWNLDRTNAAANLASNIRGQTYNEQSFQAQNDLQRALGQGELSSNIRSQDFNEKSYNSSYALDQARARAGLATDIRSGNFNEQSFNANFGLNQQTQLANLANTMRQQQATEQIGQRGLQIDALGQAGNLSTNLRNASFNEQFQRGGATDQFNIINAGAINASAAGNTQFLQNSYTNMINQRNAWDMNKLNQGIGVAQGNQNFDAGENRYGFTSGQNLASQDADAFNRAQAAQRSATANAYTGGSAQIFDAQAAFDKVWMTDNARNMGSMVDWGIGSTGGNPFGNPSQPGTTQQQSLSQPGNTWAGGGVYDPEDWTY